MPKSTKTSAFYSPEDREYLMIENVEGVLRYVSDYPRLKYEFLYLTDKNGETKNYVSVGKVSCGNRVYAKWKCLDCKHEWRRRVLDRTNRRGKAGRCPECTGVVGRKKVYASDYLPEDIEYLEIEGVNEELEYVSDYPRLQKEYLYQADKAKTAIIYTPVDDLTRGNKKYAWWRCLDCFHEWPAFPQNRTKVKGRPSKCPVCAGTKVSPDYNLAVIAPELLPEYSPDNEEAANQVHPFGGKKIKWICPSNPNHGIYIKTPYERVKLRRGCNKCSSNKSYDELRVYCELKSFFSDFEVTSGQKKFGYEIDVFIEELNFGIEVDGARFHIKERKQRLDREKSKEMESRGVPLLRLRGAPLEKSKAIDVIFDHDKGVLCGHLYEIIERIIESSFERRIISESDRNEFETKLNNYKARQDWLDDQLYRDTCLKRNNPDPGGSLDDYISDELRGHYFPERNGGIPLSEISAGVSSWKVVFFCPKSNKEFRASPDKIKSRKTVNCKFCNSLQIMRPDIAELWDYERNGDVKPIDVAANENPPMRRHFIRDHGKGVVHRFKAAVSEMTRPDKPTYCSVCYGSQGKAAYFRINFPIRSGQWDTKANGELELVPDFRVSNKYLFICNECKQSLPRSWKQLTRRKSDTPWRCSDCKNNRKS